MSGDSKNDRPKHACTDDEALVWLRDGSQESESKFIECLYRRLLEKIRHWIGARNGSGEDAHDALTEALIVFIVNFREGKYREEGKLEHFLFRVAQYKFYDICRRRGQGGRDQSIEDVFPGGIPPELGEDPDEVAEATAETELRRQKMERCLDQIGERCKERLIRFWYFGQGHEVIATVMGDASADVAKVMKGKCQRKLEKCMTSY